MSPKMCDHAGSSLECEIAKIHHAIRGVQILAPATDCLVPTGDAAVGLDRRHYEGARGQPVLWPRDAARPKIYRAALRLAVEVGVAVRRVPLEEPISGWMRFANRVPLLYQQGASLHATKAIITARPTGANSTCCRSRRTRCRSGTMAIVVHLGIRVGAVHSPRRRRRSPTHPEIIGQIRPRLDGDRRRKVASHIRKRHREVDEAKKRNYHRPLPADRRRGAPEGDPAQSDDATAKKASRPNLRDVLRRRARRWSETARRRGPHHGEERQETSRAQTPSSDKVTTGVRSRGDRRARRDPEEEAKSDLKFLVRSLANVEYDPKRATSSSADRISTRDARP